jgi:uncharacterized Zn finger protein
MDEVQKQDPDHKSWNAVVCPECGSFPADSRVLSKINLGAGIQQQRIHCDDCGEIYDVILTSD